MELDIQSGAEISGSEKRAPHDVHGCSSLRPFKWPFGGIHCQTHASCGEKNTIIVSTNSNVSFCGAYGCSNLSLSSHRWVFGKWMSKNPIFKSNDDDDDEDEEDEDDDDETLRRGCCVKRRTRHVTRVHLGRGAWNWTFRAERRYLDPKREHPTMSMVAHHLVLLNSHLEVYIVRHTHRAGEKTRSMLAQISFFFCAYGCSNLSLSSHR